MTQEDHELRRVIDMMNRRGHSHEFAVETALDRKAMERLTAVEWATSSRSKFGLSVTNIRSSDHDPPDCIGLLAGNEISIELTELVNPKILRAIDAARKNGQRITASDELFDAAQWTPDLLQSGIQDRITDKDARYDGRICVDVLIIHTAETWLSPFDVEKWLPTFSFGVPHNIGSSFLLMRYHPGYSETWPVFSLTGHLPTL